ncbi:conserved exported hypothetical protein [Tenacibaculum sediminilitoris]|uniref:transporter n=1 Tax=Tenacibaculum sediminilitoris TaxID=1820334 RepID=UPI003895B47C
MKKIILGMSAVLTYVSASAQFQETIDSGRPGNSVGVFTVGKNVFQVESGVDYLENQNLYLSNTLFKYGVTEIIEINGGVAYNFSSNEEVEMFSVGGKFNVFEGDSMLPSTGFQTTLNISNIETENSYASVLFILGYNLDENWSSTFNLGANIDLESSTVIEDSKEKNILFIEGVYTFNLSYKINDKWSTFIEPYGTLDKYYSPKIKINFNSGLSYLFTKNLKIDFLGGYKINTEEIMIGAGVSWRLTPGT